MCQGEFLLCAKFILKTCVFCTKSTIISFHTLFSTLLFEIFSPCGLTDYVYYSFLTGLWLVCTKILGGKA